MGAVRVLGMPPVVSREKIVEFDPPSRLAYTLESGLPVEGYQAEVRLEETSDGGTDIRWQSSFESARFGLARPTRLMFSRTVGDMARRLARHAEQLAAETTG